MDGNRSEGDLCPYTFGVNTTKSQLHHVNAVLDKKKQLKMF